MTLFEKSLRTLELPAVLKMLADEAASDGAKGAALLLAPSADADKVKRLLAETTEAKRMMAEKGCPTFAGLRDLREALRRAGAGGVLSAAELLGIAALLRLAREAAAYASDEGGVAALGRLFEALKPDRRLEEKIASAIVSEEEIADSASPALLGIRRSLRLASDRVSQALGRIISSPAYSKALQEPIVTVRNGRYVVPVKAEHKSAVPGLVHDVSASGATFFIEPMAVVELNNEIRELKSAERNEIERILAELSSEVARRGADIAGNLDALTELDLAFAKAKLSYRLRAVEPAITDDGRVVLSKARHPLLDPEKAVPIDIRLGGDFDTLVITGPNTGGKTVALKTLGLLPAMACCGLHIPAREDSAVPVFEKILADIGDEQSIEQSLSTFSSHMTNITAILREASEGSLLLFDEIGAGTDPIEGAALAVAVIEHARRRGAMVAATTHYSELKTYALTTPGVTNASCEFDVETLRPTYRLLIGIPGKSNAFEISRRLGLPDEVIADAKARVGRQDISFEEVLSKLEQARREAERDRENARALLAEAEEKARRAEEYLRRTEKEFLRAGTAARHEARRILQEARRAADAAVEELKALAAERDLDWRRANQSKADVYRRLNEAEDNLNIELPEVEAPTPDRPVSPGDRVKLSGLDAVAQVEAVNPDGTLELRAGVIRLRARPEEVRLAPEARRERQGGAPARPGAIRSASAKQEIDLRGMTSEEAVPLLERFIDDARMGNLCAVTVIHGKGTGALRRAVHEALRGCPGVKSFRLGRYGEGEDGVTIVELE